MGVIKGFLLLLIVAVSTAVGHISNNNDQFNRKNKTESYNENPYQVYIHQFNDSSLTSSGCSGVIIDSLYILTHSSCIKSPIESNNLVVLTNPVLLFFDENKNHEIIDGTSEHNVTEIIPYKSKENESKQLTILKLQAPIKYPAYKKPILSSTVFNDSSFTTGEFINIDDKKTSTLSKLFKKIRLTLNCDSEKCDYDQERNKKNDNNHKSKILPGSPMIHQNRVTGIFNKKTVNSSVIDYVKIDSNISLWIDQTTSRAFKMNDNVIHDQSIYQVFVETSHRDLFLNFEIFNGVIINSNHILTEAHCLMSSVDNIQVLIPSRAHYSREDFKRINVKKAFKHPKFNATSSENNIAILQLEESIDFSSNLLPISLQFLEFDKKENYIVSIDKSILPSFPNARWYQNLYFKSQIIMVTKFNDKEFEGVEIGNNNVDYDNKLSIVKNATYALMDGILVGVSCSSKLNNEYKCQKISNYESWLNDLELY